MSKSYYKIVAGIAGFDMTNQDLFVGDLTASCIDIYGLKNLHKIRIQGDIEIITGVLEKQITIAIAIDITQT